MLSGGMSVDPDDVTRKGIRMAGATEMNYGSAVLPGAMFLAAYIGEIPAAGDPGLRLCITASRCWTWCCRAFWPARPSARRIWRFWGMGDYARTVRIVPTPTARSASKNGFKSPSNVRWRRCDLLQNAHVLACTLRF